MCYHFLELKIKILSLLISIHIAILSLAQPENMKVVQGVKNMLITFCSLGSNTDGAHNYLV